MTAAPSTVRVIAIRSPLSVSMAISVSGLTPCLLAKPSAAGVHSPASFLAVLTGGPNRVSVVSSAFAFSLWILTAKRRGVANHSLSEGYSPYWVNPATTPSWKATARVWRDLGGSSSVPISMRNESFMRRPLHAIWPALRRALLLLPLETLAAHANCSTLGRPVWRCLELAKYNVVFRSLKSRVSHLKG